MRSYDLHIIEVLGDNKYVVEATANSKLKNVGVAHDFVQFTGTTHLRTKGNLTFKEHPDSVQSNIIDITILENPTVNLMGCEENLETMYEKLMILAYNMEDKLSYDETPKGKEWGKLVNKLQNFKL